MNDNQEDYFEEDSRYRQCNKEALLSVAVFVLSFIIIGGVAMLLGYGKPANEIQLILGFPAWFFYGVIVGGIIISIVPIFVVKYSFKEMSIQAVSEGSEEDK